jgi:hypothetical protein
VFDNTSFAENASTILIGMHVRKGLATKSFWHIKYIFEINLKWYNLIEHRPVKPFEYIFISLKGCNLHVLTTDSCFFVFLLAVSWDIKIHLFNNSIKIIKHQKWL